MHAAKVQSIMCEEAAVSVSETQSFTFALTQNSLAGTVAISLFFCIFFQGQDCLYEKRKQNSPFIFCCNGWKLNSRRAGFPSTVPDDTVVSSRKR